MVRQLMLLLALSACYKEEPPPPVPVAARANAADTPARYAVISENPTGFVGDTIQMGANIIDHGRTFGWKCSFESLQPEIASINSEGRLVVHKEGSVTIRATCDGNVATTTGHFSRRSP